VAGAGFLGAVLLAAVVGLTISNRLIARERTQAEAANARLNANLWLAMRILNDVYGKVGEWASLDPQRKQEYLKLLERLLGLYEQFAGQDGAEPQVLVNLASYHRQFANLLQVGGDRAKAAEHYRRALDLRTRVAADSPNVDAHEDRLPFLLFHLADSLHQAGQAAEAAEYYDRGFRILEQKVSESSKLYGDRGLLVASYYRFLAWNLATCPDPRFRDPVRAIQAGQKAATLEPGNVSAWTSVGIAHYRAGEMKEAVAALEKATAHGGGSTAWLFLAMAHSKMGEKEQARRWYDRANGGVPSGPGAFPVRHDGFRAEAAALLRIDRDQERGDGTGAPAKR
jgi:tetratricopeptide (TPR) repeat protein